AITAPPKSVAEAPRVSRKATRPARVRCAGVAALTGDARLGRDCLEVRDALEIGEAIVDLVEREPLNALGPELLHVEGREHGSVSHGASKDLVVELAFTVSIDIAEEAAGEAVSRPGRVEHGLERIAGERKEHLVGQQSRA